MTEVVRIAHPVPALYVPRGGRHVIGGLFAETTSASIRMASEDAFAPLPEIHVAIGGYRRLHAHGDALWIPMTRAEPDRRGEFVQPDDFLAWLGDDAARDPVCEPAQLAATPLLAAWDPQSNPFRIDGPVFPTAMGIQRGGGGKVVTPDLAVDRGAGGRALDRAREVSWTGTGAARDALLRFMDEDLRLTRTRVYVRTRPLLSVRPSYSEGMCPDLKLDRYRPIDHGGGLAVSPYPMRIDRAETLCRIWNRNAEHPPLGTDVIRRRIRPGTYGDADLDLMANWLPGLAVATYGKAGASRGSDRTAWERARPNIDAIRPLGLLGHVGANGGERCEASLRASERALASLAAYCSWRAGSASIRTALDYLRSELLPRASAGVVEANPDDVTALDGLAP